jgi:hypothetical protein
MIFFLFIICLKLGFFIELFECEKPRRFVYVYLVFKL